MTKDANQKSAESRQGEFPEDYHDYVFKDGKLIGDFDNMYRYAKRVPWDQDERCHHWYAEVGMLMLKERAPYETVLEIGCGLGYIAAKLKQFAKCSIDAFDVSEEAIRKARNLHPGIGFYVDNIAQASFHPQRQYDLVVVRDVFWYVFAHMATVVRNINICVKPHGFLYISQSFPGLESPYVGKEVIPTPDALIEYFSNFDPIYSARLRNHHLVNDGPILHFLGVKAG